MSLPNIFTKNMMAPVIWTEDNSLYSRTPLFKRIVTLFSFNHAVEADGKNRVIHLSTRWFWFFNSELTIPFDRIDTIETKYSDSELKNSRLETYYVVLSLKNPRERRRLISFSGSAPRNSGAPSESIKDFHLFLDELRRIVKS